jgi:ABC-type multidrug transport system fused ATPase/permease subunit
VLIDGEDIRNLNLQSLRQSIGYVGQEPVLFNTTIRENLQFACPKATEQEMIEALKAANAWDFIQKKLGDKGLDTQVGQAGGQLSGG